MKIFLADQHYPINLINIDIREAKKKSIDGILLIQFYGTTRKQVLPLVTTQNPMNPIIAPVVSNLNRILETDEDITRIL